MDLATGDCVGLGLAWRTVLLLVGVEFEGGVSTVVLLGVECVGDRFDVRFGRALMHISVLFYSDIHMHMQVDKVMIVGIILTLLTYMGIKPHL